MTNHNPTSIPTLEDIQERRRLAASQKQIVLARQANALKLYKLLSSRLALFSEQEEMLDQLEARDIAIEKIKEVQSD